MTCPDPAQGDPLEGEPPRSRAEALAEALGLTVTRSHDPTEQLHQVDDAGDPFDQISRRARDNPKLSHRAYRVLASIEGHCFIKGQGLRETWASNTTLGIGAGGIGPEAVRRALRELEHEGYIRIVPDNTKKRGSRIFVLIKLRGPADFPPLED